MRVLYITYLGLLEPLSQSQILPYLYGLSRNADIHLISFEKKNNLKNGAEFNHLQNELKRHHIAWHILTYHKKPPILSSCFDIVIGTLYALLLIWKYRITLIHARSDVPMAIGYVAKYFYPVKLLYDRRGIMGEEQIEHSGWRPNGWLYHFSLWFEKKLFHKSNAVIVLTNRMKEKLETQKILRSNTLIHTIPCCVDVEYFSKARAHDDKSDVFTFAYCGSVGTYNLIDEMFDFLNVVQKKRAVQFLILTQNQNRAEQFLSLRTDLSPKSITILFTPHKNIASYLKTADAALVFRRDSACAIAACPTKFAEYLACGLPVIAHSSVGDLKNIIETYQVGATLNNYSHSEYKKAFYQLENLLEDPEELRHRCLKAAQEIFDLENGIHKYEQIYRQMKNGKASIMGQTRPQGGWRRRRTELYVEEPDDRERRIPHN